MLSASLEVPARLRDGHEAVLGATCFCSRKKISKIPGIGLGPLRRNRKVFMKHNQTASWGFTLNPFSEMLEVNATGGAQASLDPLEATAGLRYGNEAVPAASWFFKPTQIQISDWSRGYESTPHSHPKRFKTGQSQKG